MIINLYCGNCRELLGITTCLVPEYIYCLDCAPKIEKQEEEKERNAAEYRRRMREAEDRDKRT